MNGKTDIATLAYIAGIIDGEGCLRVQTHETGILCPLVTVRMIDREPCDMIASITGARCLGNANGRIRNPNHKEQFGVWVTGRRALAFLRLIRPYLRVKAGQADALLRFPYDSGNGHSLTAEQRETRREIHMAVRRMNQRQEVVI